MTRAVLGLSHTPLLRFNPPPAEIESALRGSIEEAGRLVGEFRPDLVVMYAPDHYNGFFHDLMPPFCIGTEAQAVGDYGTPAGPLNVATDDALALASTLYAHGFDPAISRRMSVDHGFAQPLELLFGGFDSPPLIPIFINAVAAPAIPTMGRCIKLGKAVAEHFARDSRRIVFLGSGGLSHDPPIPTLEHPDPGVRERIMVRNRPTAEQRASRQERVIAAGRQMAAGTSDRRPLNPEWDRSIMDHLEHGNWAALEAIGDEEVVSSGGGSAHEVKNWVAAFAGQDASALTTRLRWYRSIPELISGFGILFRG